jgi:hypothetical protein
MKKYVVLFLLAITGSAFAQIPNGGFEYWTNVNGIACPDSWTTLNGTTISIGDTTCKKGAPGYVGSSYLKLISAQSAFTNSVIPGIATCGGTLNQSTLSITGGFPFTLRPVSLTGAWQHMVMGNNSTQGFIDVKLTHWDAIQQKRDTIASLYHTLSGMVMSWANFSIALTYDTSNTNTPDTCSVILSASNVTNAGDGDYLYIDNLGFDGYSTGINAPQLTHYVHIFPNPAADEIHVSMDKIDGETKLFIYTLNGILVKTEVLKQNEQKINTVDLSNGCYFALIIDKQRVLNQKLIIQR